MISESGKTRRRYGAQFKAMVLAQRDAPGASVARVAMSLGINDNVVHRWRQLARQREASQLAVVASVEGAQQPMQFVPLALPAPAAGEVTSEVRLEIKRAAVTVSVAWPEQALGDLADGAPTYSAQGCVTEVTTTLTRADVRHRLHAPVICGADDVLAVGAP